MRQHRPEDATLTGVTHGLGRVLVVDDDEVIRRLIAVNLQLEGFDVETAVDGQDCLARVAEIDPDVITLDVMMPRLDGWETAVQLRKSPETAHIKVVLITARAQEDDKTRGSRVGADAYLTKPFDPNEMIRVVRELASDAPLAPPSPPYDDHRRAAARDRRRGRPRGRRPAAEAGPGAGQLHLQPAVPARPRRPPNRRRPARRPPRRRAAGSPKPRSPGPASSPSPSPTPPWPAWRSGSPTPARPARKATRWPAAPFRCPGWRPVADWPQARGGPRRRTDPRLAAAAGAIIDPERAPVPAPPPPPRDPVAEAIDYAGPDAVRFALARMPPGGKPPEAIVVARHELANPAYAVRYAHAAAAGVLRWAAARGPASRVHAAPARRTGRAGAARRAVLAPGTGGRGSAPQTSRRVRRVRGGAGSAHD